MKDDLTARLRELAEHCGETLARDLRLASIHFEAASREIQHLSDAKEHAEAERDRLVQALSQVQARAEATLTRDGFGIEDIDDMIAIHEICESCSRWGAVRRTGAVDDDHRD